MKPLSIAVLWVTAGASEYHVPVAGSLPSRRPLGSVRSQLVTGPGGQRLALYCSAVVTRRARACGAARNGFISTTRGMARRARIHTLNVSRIAFNSPSCAGSQSAKSTRTTLSSERSSAMIGPRRRVSIFFGDNVSWTSVRRISKPRKPCAVLNGERTSPFVQKVEPSAPSAVHQAIAT
jgi:hypothetical protein